MDIRRLLELERFVMERSTLTFKAQRIQCARYTPTANLPYDMFLTRLYRHVMEVYPHLDNGIYDIVFEYMSPLDLNNQLDDLRVVIVERHCHSVNSSSSSVIKGRHLINMNDDDDDG
ncbi:hypothetical protein Tco_1032294 [Tanacetum coccineum]|uniref:Uncharacterized protein n=1 Tax=Tanacetum coccineum TaxID=301880 RepID=A0ABQ5GCI0_9ASTR